MSCQLQGFRLLAATAMGKALPSRALARTSVEPQYNPVGNPGWDYLCNYKSLESQLPVLVNEDAGLLTSAIQNDGLHHRRWRSVQLDIVVFKGAVVAPVSKKERLQRSVVIRGARSMEGDWPSKTVGILQRVMAVIPGGAVLSDTEFVGVVITRGNSTLRDGVDSVVFKGVQHANSMHVHCSSIIFEMVLHGNFDPIAPTGLDPRARILIIEDFASIGTGHSVAIDVLVCHIEMVLLVD